MIKRIYIKQVRKKLSHFPAIGLLGPRQCGKTTLAKLLGGVYFDLENESDITRLDAEWETLAAGKKLIILDEAQHAPWVFSRLRGTIDTDRKRNGRYLLLGSVSPSLMEEISESLAGRMGLIRMSPFLLTELKVNKLDDLWLYGGYPDGGILNSGLFPDWHLDYLELLTSRDLPAWGLTAKPQQTRRLMKMLAAIHGQPLNASQIGSSMGMDHKTVIRHCDFFEGAFLIRRVAPYFSNIKKRLVKTPRLYWRDSGLLHSLMGVETRDQLFNCPWLGASWEGFVIEQTLASLAAKGDRSNAYYFRTSDGHELDLVLERGTELWAIEIKLTSNPTTDMIGKLNKAADMIGATRRILVCNIGKKIENSTLLVTGLNGWLKTL